MSDSETDPPVYYPPESVRELQQLARDLETTDVLYEQPNPLIIQIQELARTIADSVARACIEIEVAEVHSFVAPIVAAAGTIMTGCMELLRDSGPLPDTVAVLDWLTVNTHGDSSTPLKAFFNVLKALEGMLQIGDGFTPVIAEPQRSHGLACIDVADRLTMAACLATPDTFPIFCETFKWIGNSLDTGESLELGEVLHLLVKLLTIIWRSPDTFGSIAASIDDISSRYFQRLSIPSGPSGAEVDLMLNELTTIIVKLRVVEAAGQVTELTDILLLAASLSEGSDLSASAIQPHATPIGVPLPPAKLYDRDLLVDQIISDIIEGVVGSQPAARIPISGSAGSGKTAVALTVFHHERIASAFDSNRIFFPCDELSDIDDLHTTLEASITGHASNDPISAIVAHFEDYPATLLILDGFDSEQLCHNASDFATMSVSVSVLQALENVTIIVTTRNVRPLRDFHWTTNLSSDLLEVSLYAAEQIFCDQIATTFVPEQERAIGSVVANTGSNPLVAVLLGRYVRRTKVLPTELNKTVMYASSVTGDASDVAMSLQIMISALARTGPEVIPCLSICSHFPGGLPVYMMFEIRPMTSTSGSLLGLEAVGLIARTGGVIKTPRAVRDFILEHYPVTGEHRSSVLKVSIDMLGGLDRPAKRVSLVGPQSSSHSFVNFGAMLSDERAPDELVVEAILAAAEHRPHASTSLRDVQRLSDCLRGSLGATARSDWGARCQEAMASCLAHRGEYIAALKGYDAAGDIWRGMSNIAAASWCTLRVGQCHFALKRYGDAGASMVIALAAFLDQENRRGSATTLYSLGALCVEDRRWSEAELHYKRAFLLFRTLGMLAEADGTWAALAQLRSSTIETLNLRGVSSDLSLPNSSDASVHISDTEQDPAHLSGSLGQGVQRHFTSGLEGARAKRTASVETFGTYQTFHSAESIGTFQTFETGTAVDFDEGNPGHVQAKRAWSLMEEDAVSISTFNSHMM